MVYHVTIFGLHLTINPVAFTIPVGGGWNVYWYGIFIALGFLLALVYGFKNAERCNIPTDKMLDVVLVATPLSILCARLYYIIFYKEPIHGIGDFFGFNHGGFSGLAIYGGVIGAAVFGAIMCKIRKVGIFDMFDLTAMGFLIAQACGRWGNFFNQEAFGGPTGSGWFGMTSENVAAELGEGVMAHPCFLYESLWCLAGFFLLHRVLKKRRYSGQVALCYCVWYGAGRAVIESLRTDSLYLGPFRVSQLVSVIAFIFGVVMLTVKYRRGKAKSEEDAYKAVFAANEEGADGFISVTGTADTAPDEAEENGDGDEPQECTAEPEVDEVLPAGEQNGDIPAEVPIDEVVEPGAEESGEPAEDDGIDEVVKDGNDAERPEE